MPRRCTVCVHPERAKIDEALVAGVAFRTISKQYGASPTAYFRHFAHLPAAITQAHEVAEVAQADDLLADMRDLRDDLKRGRKMALEGGALAPLALIANAEMRAFELRAKIYAELNAQNGTDVLAAPEWRAMRERVVAAFWDDPDGMAKLLAAIGDEGAGNAA